MESAPCSICLDRFVVSKLEPASSCVNDEGQKTVDSQVSIIYLVHKLLDIPLEKCAEYLKDYGNPSEWVDLCPSCKLLLQEAQDLDCKILQLQNDLEVVKLQFMCFFKVKVEFEDETQSSEPEITTAATEIRQYFSSYHSPTPHIPSPINKSTTNTTIGDINIHTLKNCGSSSTNSEKRENDSMCVDGKWQCPICVKRYSIKKSWRDHIRLKHRSYLAHVDNKIPKGHICVEGECKPFSENPIEILPVSPKTKYEDNVDLCKGDVSSDETKRVMRVSTNKARYSVTFDQEDDTDQDWVMSPEPSDKSDTDWNPAPVHVDDFNIQTDSDDEHILYDASEKKVLRSQKRIPAVSSAISGEVNRNRKQRTSKMVKGIISRATAKLRKSNIPHVDEDSDENDVITNGNKLDSMNKHRTIGQNFKHFKCRNCGVTIDSSKKTSKSQHMLKNHDVHVNYRKTPKEVEVHWEVFQGSSINSMMPYSRKRGHGRVKPSTKCRFCGIVCSSTGSMYRHMCSKHGFVRKRRKRNIGSAGEKDWETLCNERKESEQKLKSLSGQEKKKMRNKLQLSSMARKHRIDEYPCKKCNTTLTTFKDWNNHMISVHKTGYQCKICDRVLSSYLNLENHVRSNHRPPSILFCSGCDKKFPKCDQFNQHLKRNPICEGKAISCNQCVMRLGTQECLDLHLEIRHVLDTLTPFKCPTCNLSFNWKIGLKRHQLIHLKEESKICEECGNVFASIYRLKNHIRQVHRSRDPGAPQYCCKVCDKKFPTRSGLTRHDKIHGDEYPHLCTICGKRFKIRNYLTIHLWSHDPDRREKYSSYKPKLNSKSKAKKSKFSKTSMKSTEPHLNETLKPPCNNEVDVTSASMLAQPVGQTSLPSLHHVSAQGSDPTSWQMSYPDDSILGF